MKEITKYAFIFAGIIILFNVAFLSGQLIGMYGSGEAKGFAFAIFPIALFWIGRWSYKYKDYNPF